MHIKMSSAILCHVCFGLQVLNTFWEPEQHYWTRMSWDISPIGHNLCMRDKKTIVFYLHAFLCIQAETKWPSFSRRHFQMHYYNGNVSTSMKISLNFARKDQINNTSVLVQIITWHRPGERPLSERMMVSELKHIMRHTASMSQLKICMIFLWVGGLRQTRMFEIILIV